MNTTNFETLERQVKKLFRLLHIQIFTLIFAARKRKVLFFKHFPQGSKSFQMFGTPAGSN